VQALAWTADQIVLVFVVVLVLDLRVCFFQTGRNGSKAFLGMEFFGLRVGL